MSMDLWRGKLELLVKLIQLTANDCWLNTGVPWIMCKHKTAPDPIIDTCNDFYCEGFRPNKPYKMKMWTEVWTGWYTKFGGPVPCRLAEDLAFSVARFVQNNGS